jgi:hypothetical protein
MAVPAPTRAAAAGGLDARPYKGAEPYEFWDGELFFGREATARAIIGTVLSSPVTFLHAPSGAGKTSLVNTRVLPGLEANGLTTVAIRLWDAPVDAVRDAVLAQVFPDPMREGARLADVVQTLSLDAGVRLGEALEAFDRRREGDPSGRGLLGAVEGQVPFVSRLLNGSLDLARYLETLNFVTAGSIWPPGELLARQHELSLADLMAGLRRPAAVTAHDELIRSLRARAGGLVGLIDEIFTLCSGALESFELILCFDQFEEIFTRFRDDPRAGTDSWMLREALLDELRRLAAAAYWAPPGATAADEAGPTGLGVRLLFSFRDEFLASMDRLHEFIPHDALRAYHLDFMRVEEAREAIVNPARAFAVEYEPACLDEILAQLVIEQRFVEPSHLSIVCERFWKRTRDSQAEAEAGWGASLLTLDLLTRAGGVPGLLRAIVTDALEGLGEAERLEALDLVWALQSEPGTRRIIPMSDLVRRPFRTATRARVLAHLQDRYFVRTHHYRGSDLVEVTHEALLRAFNEIRDEVQARHPEFFHSQPLLSRMEDRLQSTAETARWDPLTPADLETIQALAGLVDWHEHAGASELVLRSWLHRTDREAELQHSVRRWSSTYRRAVELEQAQDRPSMDARSAFLANPSLWRLAVLSGAPTRPWQPDERAAFLRALMQLDHSRDGRLTVTWLSRLERP